MIILTEFEDKQWRCLEYFDRRQVESCTQSEWSAKDSELVAQTVQNHAPNEAIYDGKGDPNASAEQKELALLGIKSQLGVALRSGDATFGCLILQQCDLWREWQPDEVEFVQRVADAVAEALAQAGGGSN